MEEEWREQEKGGEEEGWRGGGVMERVREGS